MASSKVNILARYSEYYGFEIVEPLGLPTPLLPEDRIKLLAREMEIEPFRERRKILARELFWAKAALKLGADYINLGIRWASWIKPDDYSRKPAWETPTGIFIGGLKERVMVIDNKEGVGRWLYTGFLPDSARIKSLVALKLFAADQVLVASRHREFFDMKPIVFGSPLLLVADKVLNRQLLLAAWGLIDEVPNVPLRT